MPSSADNTRSDTARRPWLWPTIWASLLAIIALEPLLQWYAVSRHGSIRATAYSMVMVMLLLASSGGVLLSIAFQVPRSHRRMGAMLLLTSVSTIALTIAALRFGGYVRHQAFDALAQRSAPLVNAIARFERDTGAPPPNLAALVPGYLPVVPATGMRAYPNYDYEVSPASGRFEDNPWMLSVRATTAPMGFDQFIYLSRQSYPERGFGGSLRRVRDWAYVHE